MFMHIFLINNSAAVFNTFISKQRNRHTTKRQTYTWRWWSAYPADTLWMAWV